MFPISEKWPYIGDILWGSAAYFPLITCVICSEFAPYVGIMGLSFVVGLTASDVLISEAGPNQGGFQALPHEVAAGLLLGRAMLSWWLAVRPGSFQILPLHWDSVHVSICTCSLIVESVSYSPQAHSYASLTGFQCQAFWGLVFTVQAPQSGDPDVELRPLAPQ